MKHAFLIAVVLASGTIAMADAPPPAASTGRVGIIDIEKIANELGVSARIQEQTTREDANAKQQLQTLYGQLRKEIEDAKATLGPFPTTEQSNELNLQQAKANEQLKQRESALRQGVLMNRNAAIEKFRDALKPVIAEVARGNNIAVVLANSGMIVWSEDTADLTAAVLAKAREAGIK